MPLRREDRKRSESARLTLRKLRDIVLTIYEAVLHLPKPVRRVCIVRDQIRSI